MLKARRVGTGFSPYIDPANDLAFRPWGTLCLFASAKNRTSGHKGHKDDNVYAGVKSPARTLKASFSPACKAWDAI
jgi:hypothetical protein